MTHWSSRLLAEELKIAQSTVLRTWRHYRVQPWRAETFKFSTDPELVAKVTDVVGLYLNPPENAIVLCVDEKSQIQALDRTQKMLPMRTGSPEKHTHDYVRHGTSTLFAALDIATGKVTAATKPRHRRQEFLAFLKQVARAHPDRELHLVMDNYAAHKTPEVKDWLAATTHGSSCTSPRPPGPGSTSSKSGSASSNARPSGAARSPPSTTSTPRSGVHHRLEQTQPTIRLDQTSRTDPRPKPNVKLLQLGPLAATSIPTGTPTIRHQSINYLES